MRSTSEVTSAQSATVTVATRLTMRSAWGQGSPPVQLPLLLLREEYAFWQPSRESQSDRSVKLSAQHVANASSLIDKLNMVVNQSSKQYCGTY